MENKNARKSDIVCGGLDTPHGLRNGGVHRMVDQPLRFTAKREVGISTTTDNPTGGA